MWPGCYNPFHRYLIISYDTNCVSNDEQLWLEVKAACEFSRDFTQGRTVSQFTLRFHYPA